MIEQDKQLPHSELTGNILNCCFEVQECIIDVDMVEEAVLF